MDKIFCRQGIFKIYRYHRDEQQEPENSQLGEILDVLVVEVFLLIACHRLIPQKKIVRDSDLLDPCIRSVQSVSGKPCIVLSHHFKENAELVHTKRRSRKKVVRRKIVRTPSLPDADVAFVPDVSRVVGCRGFKFNPETLLDFRHERERNDEYHKRDDADKLDFF